jgi:two-component system response regulator MprA
MPRPSDSRLDRALPPRDRSRETSPADTPAEAARRPATILLVDDDPAVREGLRRVLINEGWEVVTAASGAEALEEIDHREPGLLITDLCMNQVDGWDLLFHERLQRPGLPVFVITALAPYFVAGADSFATEFFQKPIDLEALLRAIARCLGPQTRVDSAGS